VWLSKTSDAPPTAEVEQAATMDFPTLGAEIRAAGPELVNAYRDAADRAAIEAAAAAAAEAAAEEARHASKKEKAAKKKKKKGKEESMEEENRRLRIENEKLLRQQVPHFLTPIHAD